ncbi:MAG: hypothetical protein JWL82_464 [Parcubacteria group bacterium]|nr:hypothetical protein [Parcubacteria group bacterium]
MKKRIVYLTHWRFPSEKTMTPLIMKTCAGFVLEGYETELWIPKRHNPEWEGKDPFVSHAIDTRFPVHRIPALDFLRFLGSFGFLLLVLSFNVTATFLLLFGDRKKTYLYAHDVRDVLLPCLLGYPVFVEIHDFYESSQGWVNRLVFKRASGLIVTNTLKRAHIHDAYGVPLNRMIHQPNAVEYDFFHIPLPAVEARAALGLPQDKRLVLYTGHLFSWKGVDTLALAAAHLPDDIHTYFVGGTPEDRMVLEAFVREHALPRIEFLPHQEHARIPLFLRAADILVLPNTAREAASKYETSPVKLFEYMSSGIPIVASDLPSIRDIVNEDEVAFFMPDDPESLAKVIGETLEDKADAASRAEHAARHAQKLSWASRAAAIAGLIRATTEV